MKTTHNAILVNDNEFGGIIEQAVINVIADGGFEVPMDNPFGGADLWKEGQAGLVRDRRTGYLHLSEGIRVADDDGTVTVYRFEKTGVAQKASISQPTAAQVEALIRVML